MPRSTRRRATPVVGLGTALAVIAGAPGPALAEWHTTTAVLPGAHTSHVDGDAQLVAGGAATFWYNNRIGETQNPAFFWDVICDYQASRIRAYHDGTVYGQADYSSFSSSCAWGDAYFDLSAYGMTRHLGLKAKWKSNHTGAGFRNVGTLFASWD